MDEKITQYTTRKILRRLKHSNEDPSQNKTKLFVAMLSTSINVKGIFFHALLGINFQGRVLEPETLKHYSTPYNET